MPNDKRKPPKPRAQKPAAAAAPTTAGDSSVTVDRHSDYSSLFKWEIPDFPNIKAKALSSPYFQVGGFDFRFLINPKGDSLAFPGTISLFLAINNPRGSSFDNFACYKIKIVNFLDDKLSVCRENGYRFSKSKKSIGWSDFALAKSVLDPNSGLLRNGSLFVSADICVLNDLMSVSSDSTDAKSHVYDGKVTWTIKNFGSFKDVLKKVKIISPNFRVGEANFRINLYESVVNEVEYLSACLEVKENDKSHDRSCWCLFRVSVLNQNPGLNHFHRDGYGRFSAQGANEGDSTLGWNEYMTMFDFIGKGYLVEDTVVISVSFNAIRDRDFVFRVGNSSGSKGAIDVAKKHDGCRGKFVWKIENFGKLKDVLKKKKMTGLVIISSKFQVGNLNFRLLVYPRGQSQMPLHLSLFLEVWDLGNTSNGDTSFVFYRLEVVNHKTTDKSIMKESQNRYSKATKDWGWSEFMTLTNLFDRDSGYLDRGTVIFTADVRIMKETFIVRDITDRDTNFFPIDIGRAGKQITWKVENYLSLKDMMATTLKICSEFFHVGGCKLRIGVYESSENVFMYLERDLSAVDDCDLSFWFRISVVNQKDPAKSLWKDSSLCMNDSTNSNIQLMKVTDMLGPDAGFVVHDAVLFACDVLDYCPEFSKPELLALDCDQDDIASDIYELYASEKGKGILKLLLVSTGLYPSDCDNSGQLLANLRNLMDASAVARLLVGMRVFLDDPVKAKSLICRDKFFGSMSRKKVDNGTDESKKNLTDLTTGIRVLQQIINDLLLDILVECCQPSDVPIKVPVDASTNTSAHINTCACQSEPHLATRPVVSMSSVVDEGFSSDGPAAVGCSVVSRSDLPKNPMSGQCESPPKTSSRHPAGHISEQALKAEWPEPSEELLQIIVSSLKSVDGPVPQLHSEPMQRSQSAEKVFLLLKKVPRHLQTDLVSLLPKLVNHSEHHLAASALLHQLQKVDAEPTLKTFVLAAVNRFKLDNGVWEAIFYEAFPLLEDSNNEVLGVTIDFFLAAASHCQHIPQAVRVIRAKMGNFGVDVSPSLLDSLRKTINSYQKIAEVMLREIDLVFALNTNCLTNPRQLFVNDGDRYEINFLHAVNEPLIHSHYHFSDIFILIDMLAMPSLAIEASHAFERGVAHGHVKEVTVALVMERLTQNNTENPVASTENCGHEDTERNLNSLYLEKVFSSILALAETLTLSTNPKVHSFLKMFYATQFGMFSGKSYHRRMLRSLVDRATNISDHSSQINLDILVSLVHRESRFAGPILNMMKDVAVNAKTDHSNIWHQLCTMKEDIIRIQEEKQAELSAVCKEKEIMSERLTESDARLTESEATICNYKSEMKLQSDRFVKLSVEKKDYQECLHHIEKQLSQKSSELKAILEENKVLIARIRNVEAERKRELKRHASEVVGQDKAQQKLLDEIGQLKGKSEHIAAMKEEKEEQLARKEEELARCRSYIDYIEAKLNACQQYIRSLEDALRDEISQHAPLYGVGLEELSWKELETLARIHEEGLNDIRAIQQRASNPGYSP